MPGPSRPELDHGSLHVWRADLGAVDDDVLRSLSPSEQRRAGGFPRRLDGRLWARAHAVLRGLLAGYLDVEAAAVDFALDDDGKPIVHSAAAGGSLSFNISHSGPLALYAFAESSVGVDVEVSRRRPANYVALAARAFGADQARRLEGLAPTAREPEFLRAWVMHEASLKCEGRALGGVRKSACAPHRPPWLAELDVGDRAVAALAAARRPAEVHRFCWISRRASTHACA